VKVRARKTERIKADNINKSIPKFLLLSYLGFS
jgi:hypothetical protein